MVLEQIGPVKRAAIVDADGTGDIVAAVTGKAIRVLSLFVTGTVAAGTLKFQSGGTTALTGAMLFAANGQLNLAFNPCGHFQTAVGEKLDSVGAASIGAIGGFIVYQEVLG